MNYFKTGVLLIALTMLFVWVGGYFGGRSGATFAFIMALLMNLGAYWFSDRIVLAMYGAQEVMPNEVPELYNIVRDLTTKSNLPMPKLYIVSQNAPNAFATGRSPNRAAVCVTQGILSLLNREELEGVIAHELSHIKNRDTLIMTIAATIAGAITMLANWARWTLMFGGRDDRERGSNPIGLIVMLILAPLAALLIQLAISRSREYFADESAAKMSQNPVGLARALGKLERGLQVYPMQANPATSHIFIANPLSGDVIASLFSTHPPIRKRIERLESMVF